jgi:hypothetical protein
MMLLQYIESIQIFVAVKLTPIAYVYPPFFANITITYGVSYHYPMIKVEWLAAGVLLISSSKGLVNARYQIRRRGNCNGNQRLAELGDKYDFFTPIT